VREARHWYEVIDYWVLVKKRAKIKRRGTSSFRSTRGGATLSSAASEAALSAGVEPSSRNLGDVV
jgi:hypothetical protein